MSKFFLRRENANLEMKISNATTEYASMSMSRQNVLPPPTEVDFPPTPPPDFELDHIKREFPLTSEGLAKAEATIITLSKDMETHVKNLQDMERDLRKSVRRSHLEAESTLQYSMRDSVKIFGVPFNPNENTNDIVQRIGISIGVHIGENDISVSHRTGRVNGSNPRPIVVKFTKRDMKHMVMRNKRNARNIKADDNGTPVRLFIDEHLTPMRTKVCKQLREEKVPHYTRDGKVFILQEERGDIKKVIDTPEDWEQVDIPDSLKVELLIYPRD